ncbi:hypothetical protein SEA_LILBEANIE_86 [Gordonia phage Lilbeanie]|uniref:Uncharacterized protein n=1 Tax=Gordonia phage Lilbeanie TaxID=2794947 RepID=A0A7T1KSC5_9CAUD|nr:hypothetical protein J1773_gp86 [Gordonia phage Lilbeanie]QPO17164.1 hypothetical protein SEA_LILBEANIE_86 [Gordonia phage Lilbeanie]
MNNPLEKSPEMIRVIGGKGDAEGKVIVLIGTGRELHLPPASAFRLARKLIRQAVREKIGVAW